MIKMKRKKKGQREILKQEKVMIVLVFIITLLLVLTKGVSGSSVSVGISPSELIINKIDDNKDNDKNNMPLGFFIINPNNYDVKVSVKAEHYLAKPKEFVIRAESRERVELFLIKEEQGMFYNLKKRLKRSEECVNDEIVILINEIKKKGKIRNGEVKENEEGIIPRIKQTKQLFPSLKLRIKCVGTGENETGVRNTKTRSIKTINFNYKKSHKDSYHNKGKGLLLNNELNGNNDIKADPLVGLMIIIVIIIVGLGFFFKISSKG